MGQEITLTASDGGRFAAYLALPTHLPAPGLIVLPEVFNTNPHIRSSPTATRRRDLSPLAPDVFWRQEAAKLSALHRRRPRQGAGVVGRARHDEFARDLGDMVAALRGRPESPARSA